MFKPVTLVWINYNSINFIDLVLKSLKSLYDLDYPKLSILVLDNCSNDGSDRILRENMEKVDKRGVMRFYRSSRNYGYAGGNLLGYLLNGESEYFTVVNDDVIVENESLLKMVEFLEKDMGAGAVQGLLRSPNGTINCAGHLLDEFLVSYAIGLGKRNHSYVNRSHNVTYTCGAYSVYRVKALKKLGEVYFPEAFGYLDDDLIGLRLWSLGYKSKYVPVETGTHYGGTTFTKYNMLADECNVRNRLIFRLIAECRFKKLAVPASIFRLIPAMVGKKSIESVSRAIVYGINYARERMRRGCRIKVDNAPLIRLTPLEIMAHTILPNRLSKRLVIKRLEDRIPLG